MKFKDSFGDFRNVLEGGWKCLPYSEPAYALKLFRLELQIVYNPTKIHILQKQMQ